MSSRDMIATLFGQLAKYAVAGGVAALVYAVAYLVFADLVFPDGYATLAVAPAFCIALAVSFLLHSRWTFAGHGGPKGGSGQMLRFAAVQFGGLCLNAAFTYLVTVRLGAENWQALIPCLTLTPLATFAAQRAWVFR